MKNILIILVALVIIVVITVVIANSSTKGVDTDDMEYTMEKEMTDKDDEMVKDMPSEESLTAGVYEEYLPEKISASDGAILFFHASWCPTCRSADKDINESLQDIPNGVTILKVNYDKESALKQKYEVRYQHTFVQVDGDGNKVAVWTGSPTLEAVLEKVQ